MHTYTRSGHIANPVQTLESESNKYKYTGCIIKKESSDLKVL